MGQTAQPRSSMAEEYLTVRVCMILSTPLPPREGIGFYSWNLSQQLRAHGHEVDLVTRRLRGEPARETVDGVTIWRPPFAPVYPFHVHVHGQYVQRLVQHLEPSTDVFHLHTPLVYPIRTTKPLLVTIHTPLISDIAAIPATNRLAWLTKLQGPVSYHLERQLFARADRLTAVATSVANEMSAYGIAPDQVRVLGNGVNTDLFHPAADGPERDHPYFLTTARLGLRKGLEDLIAAAALVREHAPGHRFLIAGTGPLEAALRADIARLGLGEQVELLGHVGERAHLAELLRRATAYVHPAHYEGLSTALLEAMASGRPVIATAVSGALDVVTSEQNGLLVPPRQPRAIADAVLRLIAAPNDAERWGAAARRTVEERYTWAVVGDGYIEEYERLVA